MEMAEVHYGCVHIGITHSFISRERTISRRLSLVFSRILS